MCTLFILVDDVIEARSDSSAMASPITKVLKGFPVTMLRSYCRSSHSKVFSIILENKKTGYAQKQLIEVVDDVTSQYKPCQEFPEFGAYLKRAAEYTTTHGKKIRYAMTVNAYEMVEESGLKNMETLKLAQISGICWELANCSFLMSDDLEDGSTTRHYQPCWYTLPDVGVKVITDIILIRGLQHEIFNKWFDQHPQRWVLFELFNKMYFYTAIGQYIERVLPLAKNEDYAKYTTKQWETLIDYKTTGYTFFGPIYSGLLLTQRKDLEQLRQLVKEICSRLSYIFSMQNDFYDAYGDMDILRKDGTDIQEGKCTWLAVTALRRATLGQRSVFARNYGRADADHVTKIKQLYDDLQLQEVFAKTSRLRLEEIETLIQKLPDDRLKMMMMDIVSCLSNDVFASYGGYQRGSS